jgi:hypothetical protein
MLGAEFTTKLRRLMEAREKRDTSKAAAENAEKDYRELESELWEEIAESPVEGSIKIDLGEPYGKVTFGVRETYYGRVLDADAALEYFEQTARVDEFTQPKIVPARVNELVREKIESGEMDMPDGIDFYARRYIAISRPKG